MNSLLDGGTDDEPEVRGRTGAAEEADLYPYAGGRASRGASSGDHEITLGTMTVLAIFFALAVVCAGFFGFGYSVGSKRAVAQSGAANAAALPPANAAGVPECKPAPGSPLVASAAKPAAASSDGAAAPGESAPVSVHPAAAVEPVRDPDSMIVGERPAPHAAAPASAAPVAPAAAAGTTMVQVAALSHQSDAELVASTLKSRGYAVSIHSSPQDSLLHVQVGPFATRKDAEAMRQRLLNDGFNAILK